MFTICNNESDKKNPRYRIGLERTRRMLSAGQTYDELLTEMIELRKKRRLVEDIRQSMQEDDFVPTLGIYGSEVPGFYQTQIC